MESQLTAAPNPMLELRGKMNRSTLATFVARKVLSSMLVLAVTGLMAIGRSRASDASSWNPERASSERSQNMKIKISVAGKVLTATLVDNETARDFVSLLPLNLSLNDLFGREKFGNLPKALSEKGPRTHAYEVGDIAYWSPAHDVAIYYRQDSESIPSPGIIPIGKIDGGTEVFNVPASVKVTIELAK
jgi:Uncharacterized conserved protein